VRLFIKVGEKWIPEVRVIIHFENLTPRLLSKMLKIKMYNTILHFFSGYDKWFLTSKEHRSHAFGNRIRKIFGPTRDEVTE
jgi:hypothetical protein